MKKILVTGSRGFIGKNLMVALSRRNGFKASSFDSGDELSSLAQLLQGVDIVYHLAGVNRPEHPEDFEKQNAGLTAEIVTLLQDMPKKIPIVFASSTQALEKNPYGISKKKAEDILAGYNSSTGSPVYIYRLTNVFGKWCRPNYNSVVATFCHNICHGIDISIANRNKEMELIYVDDVISSFTDVLDGKSEAGGPPLQRQVGPSYKVTLGELADKIFQFRNSRRTLVMPDLSDEFTQRLYATYLSYLDKDDFSYELGPKSDDRGSLTEIIKSEQFGQMFVSTSHAGVIRGGHYHDTKIEKFLVLKGEALIKLRHVLDSETISYNVSGKKLEVVDIPPGYTHSIENLSDDEMIVLFWAGKIFDPGNPDTHMREV